MLLEDILNQLRIVLFGNQCYARLYCTRPRCTYIILKELSTQLGGENIMSAEFMVILLIGGFWD